MAGLRAVVTGGAGFIGGHVATRLVAEGWRTLVLDDLSTGRLEHLPDGADLERLDVASERAVAGITDYGPTVIIHCAAQVSVARSMADPHGDWRTNVVGTSRVLEAARASGARLVFASSGGAIYGDTQGADESAVPAPRSYYAVHKYVAERYVELSGVPSAIARLANVYGPGQRVDLEGGVVAIFADALSSSAPITIHGGGLQRRDFVHVADVVDAIVAMAVARPSGLWNVGTGISTSILELLDKMIAIFGPAVEVRQAPVREGDVFSSRLVVDRIRADLGWVPTVDLEHGLQTCRGSGD